MQQHFNQPCPGLPSGALGQRGLSEKNLKVLASYPELRLADLYLTAKDHH